jgi:hypothetical protein
MARVAEIQAQMQRAFAPAAPAPAPTQFEQALAAAYSPTAVGLAPPVFTPGFQLDSYAADTPGGRALAIAQGEVGVSEMPPGSNESPRIAEYRTATAGAYPGAPWCAYFVSWAAAQAGTPIGDGGSGLGAVAGVTDWATRTGRLLPPGVEPAPGDLILFGDRHIGIVESVNPDGSLMTVEGNHESAVSRVRRSRTEATGFVRL